MLFCRNICVFLRIGLLFLYLLRDAFHWLGKVHICSINAIFFKQNRNNNYYNFLNFFKSILVSINFFKINSKLFCAWFYSWSKANLPENIISKKNLQNIKPFILDLLISIKTYCTGSFFIWTIKKLNKICILNINQSFY